MPKKPPYKLIESKVIYQGHIVKLVKDCFVLDAVKDKVVTREGEKPLLCAKRELEEETGYTARRWRCLTRFFSAPGISDEVMTLFKMIKNGLIRDAKTIAGILWISFFQ